MTVANRTDRNISTAVDGGRTAAYRDFVDGLSIAVYITDERGVITLFNEAAAEFWGRSPVLGSDQWCGSLALFWPDGRPMQHEDCPMAVAIKEDRPVREMEAIVERPDGSRRWFVPYPTPLHSPDGELIGAVNVLVDITDRKNTEDELREAERRASLALAAGRLGAWEWNCRTGEVTWSESLELIHGITPGTFDGTFDAYLSDVHPDDKETLLRQISASMDSGVHEVEYRIVRPDGAIRWVNGSGSVMYDSAGEPLRVIGVCQDITDRKEDERKQQLLAEAAGVFAGSLDLDEVLERVAQLIVDSMADWCAIDILEDDGTVRRPQVTHADPAKADIADRLRQFTPDPTTALAVANALRNGASILEPELSEVQLAGAAVDEEHLEIMRDLGFKSAMVVPLLTRDRLLGAITFVSAESGRSYMADDLSLAEDLAARAALAIDNARLYREAQFIQEKLLQANEAKDEFLGLVSHELRTPITTIYGGARVLRSRRTQLSEENREEVLRDIEQESERLHRLVEDLLVLARLQLGQEIETEPVLVQRVVEKVVKSLGQRSSRVFELDLRELPAVSGDSTYLEQVLRNLIVNAEKYNDPDAPVTIRVHARDDEAIVSVLDRGPGVEEGEEESIFERFYRSESSRKAKRGLGLGLTVCKRLIEAQDGRIWAERRRGGGLEVSFAMPFYQEEPHGN